MLNNLFCSIQLTLVLIVSMSLYSQESRPNIGIIDFESSGLEPNEARVLSDKFRYVVMNSGKYNILERNQMDEILKEQGFQQTGCTTDKCVVEIGQLLNVSQIVAGSVGKIGNSYLLTARIVDVQTGKITQMSKVEISGSVEDILKSGIDGLVAKLIKADSKETFISNVLLEKISEVDIRNLFVGQLNGELRELSSYTSIKESGTDQYWQIRDIWQLKRKKEYVASVVFRVTADKIIVRTYRYMCNDGAWHQTTSKYENR